MFGLKFYSAPVLTPGQKFHVKSLKFYVKVFFKILYFLNPLIDVNYNWIDEKWWFKILLSINSTPGHDLQVKVIDLDIKAFRDIISLTFILIYFHISTDNRFMQYYPNRT